MIQEDGHAQSETAVHEDQSHVFSPIFSNTLRSGYIRDWNGTSIAAVKQRNTMLERMVLLLTIAHAANEETITRSRMEKKVIMSQSQGFFQS